MYDTTRKIFPSDFSDEWEEVGANVGLVREGGI